MQLGLNARAGLITRGLNEMLRLAAAIGAKPETLMGLAGLGDLVLTCTGDLSRNRRLGLALGRGQTLQDAVREIGQVVESVQTADEVMRQARRHGIDLPISDRVRAVLHGEQTPEEGCAHCWRGNRNRNIRTRCSSESKNPGHVPGFCARAIHTWRGSTTEPASGSCQPWLAPGNAGPCPAESITAPVAALVLSMSEKISHGPSPARLNVSVNLPVSPTVLP